MGVVGDGGLFAAGDEAADDDDCVDDDEWPGEEVGALDVAAKDVDSGAEPS